MPSSCDGTTTALAALIQYGTSSAGHAAEREQPDVARRLLRAIEALERPRRVVREQEVRAVGVRARAARAPRARDRPEAREVDAAGEDRDAPRPARAGHVLAERARDRRGQVHERERASVAGRERGCSRSLPCMVTDERVQPGEQRRPRDEPEVHVHDVERLAAVAAAAARVPPAGSCACRPGTRTARSRRPPGAAAPRPGRARTARRRAARGSGTCS
jgi:hypothetical protein